MVLEGYSLLPPQVREHTDVALETTSKYAKMGFAKAQEGYDQAVQIILEQYKIHSPKAWQHWHEFSLLAQVNKQLTLIIQLKID